MLQDLRLALRRLGKSPAWTLAAVAVLALGLGLGTTVFAVIDALVLEPPRVSEPQRLLNVFASGGDGESGVSRYEPMAYPDYRDLRWSAQGFASMTAYAPTTITLETAAGGAGWTGFGSVAEVVERNYFETLGVTPVVGRSLFDADANSCNIAVLGWRLHQRFGGHLGGTETVRVNGLPVTVVGVAPRGFRGLTRGLEPELWLPMDCIRELSFDRARNVRLGRSTPGQSRFEDRGVRWVWVVGRLHSDVSPAMAHDEIAALGERLGREHPKTNEGRRFLTSSTADLRLAPDIDERLATASGGSLAVAVCVLLVACGNVAALLLIRSQGRCREIAARRALGAGTLCILRLLWLEGAVIAGLGTVGALSLGAIAAGLLRRLELPVPIPIELGVGIDGRVVLFTVAAAFATTLIFVSAPALEHLRRDLASALRTGSAGASAGQHRLLSGSVILQITVSLALWIAAATAGQGLLQARQVDPGCQTEGVATARFDLGLQGFSADERADVHDRAAVAVARLPGASAVSFAGHLPLSMELLLTRVAAQEPGPSNEGTAADWAAVDVDYFATLGVELLAGRGFTPQERDEELPVAVVNLELARTLWPEVDAAGDALGRQLWQLGQDQALRVVGVARVGKYRSLAEPPRPFFYRPLSRDAAGARTLLVHFGGQGTRNVAARKASIERALASVEPRLIVHRLQTADEAMAPSLLIPRTAATVLAAFSTLALLLTAVGLYGVLGQSVVLRRREIGIRMAVGGAPARVALETVSARLPQVLIGIAAGVLAGILLSKHLTSFVDVTGDWQARSVAAACVVVMCVAVLAALLPALRAARVDPARVLSSE